MTAIVTERHTPEDLLVLPGTELVELVDGRLVEKHMGAEADWIAVRLITRLGRFAEDAGLGWVFGAETGYQCFSDDPLRVRKPDLSFVRAGRLVGNRIPRGHITIVPDLVVEVVSPNDLFYEVTRKVEEYREAGVPLVWVVNPEARTIEVRAAGEATLELQERDELTGGSVVPGFLCAVAELFPPVGE